MIRNGYSLVGWLFCFYYHVTTFLADKGITPIAAKSLNQLLSTQIAKDFQEAVRTLSRTK
jgi:hypothetical protein